MLATDNVHNFMRPGPQERQISLELSLWMNFLVWRPPWSTTSTHQGSVFFTGRVKWEGRGAARVIWDLISSITLSKNNKLLKANCESRGCNTAGRVCFHQIGWWGGGVGFFVLWTGRVLCLNNSNRTFCLYLLQVRHRMFAWKRKSTTKLTLLCLLEFVVNVSSIPWLKEKKNKGKGESLINTETQLPGHFSLLNTMALFF